MILVTGATGNVGSEVVNALVSAGEPVRVPFPNVPAASLDPYDLAAVAVRALLSEEYRGEILRPTVLEVTGREPRTFADWATAHAGDFQ